MESLYIYISYLALGIPTLPFGLGLLFARRLSRRQWWLMAALGLALLTGGLAEWLLQRKENNLWVYHLHFPLEMAFLTLVFRDLLRPAITWIAIVAFGAVSLAGVLYWSGPDQLPSLSMTLESIWMIILSFWFFLHTYRSMDTLRLERHPLLWVSTGNLLYFSGNLLLFIFGSLIFEKATEFAMEIWMTNCILLVIRSGLFSIALLCKDPN